MIQAEVFDDFLDQAKHLLGNGYYAPAAVIAGSVLEDGLRKLCAQKGITLSAKPKLDSMNAELAKSGAYNVLTQKKLPHLLICAIRLHMENGRSLLPRMLSK